MKIYSVFDYLYSQYTESRKEFLTDREKNLLKKVSKTLSGEEKLLIENIINKFSIPKGE